MAIIKPSRQFQGSDLSTGVFGKIIKDGIRQINFRDDNYKNGAYFFILPPYKVDSDGNGVWYKTLPVRDNFGIGVKESFAVPPNCPIQYFSSQCTTKFPDYAKIEKNVPMEGSTRTRTNYPPFGRVANKVIFNVVPYQEMNIGAHIMLLPQFGAAENIERWGRKKDPRGDLMPMLNDPARAIPVFVQLQKGDVKGNPWLVTIDNSNPAALPTELSDTEYLYNLDDVVHYWDPQYLIDKLRSFTPGDIFDACMAGYSGFPVKVSMAAPTTFTAPIQQAPQPAPARPVLAPPPQAQQQQIPRASIPSAVPVFNTASPMPQNPIVTSDYTPVQSNPNATLSPKFTVEQARALLQQTKPQ